MDGTLTVTIPSGHSEPGSNENERTLKIIQNSRTADSSLDYIKDKSCEGSLTSLQRRSRRILQYQPTGLDIFAYQPCNDLQLTTCQLGFESANFSPCRRGITP